MERLDFVQNRQYIKSERAHLMCPNMQFGIIFTVKADYDEQKVQHVITQLCQAHPFLKCLVAQDETGNYYYDYHEEQSLSATSLESKDQLEADYTRITSSGWNIQKEPLLKIYTYPDEQYCTILMIAHHILCDGRGLLGLVNEFANAYAKGNVPAYAAEQLIQSIQDLPKGSNLSWISKCVVSSANRNWIKEHHKVEYEDYLAFEKEFLHKEHNQFVIEEKSEQEVNQYQKLCHENQISVNDYLMAEMMINENTSKVLIAADIRKYLNHYRAGSLGNYSTAFGIVCKQKCNDKVALAKMVHHQVQKYINSPKRLFMILACYFNMNPELLDAVAISTLGSYVSKAGKFVGDNMFGYRDRNGYSITNLGKLENDAIIEATFIPPVSPANKVMQGVLTVNGRMKICTVRNK